MPRDSDAIRMRREWYLSNTDLIPWDKEPQERKARWIRYATFCYDSVIDIWNI